MAERLEEFPERPRQAAYPWDQWLDGNVWRLVRGEDFRAGAKTMRARLRQQARLRGGRARTTEQSINGVEHVVVQFRRF